MGQLFTQPAYIRGGLSTGMAIADKQRELAKQQGLASGFTKVINGDNSGWGEAFQADPKATMDAWNTQQALKQKNLERSFNTTNEYKNAQYLMSLGYPQEKAIEIAYKQNQNPTKELTPYDRTLQQEEAKNRAEVQQKANALESGLPAFEEMAKQLNEVGKDATYTMPGQAWDWTVRNLGLGATKGAEARERYRQIVNNELLPKLRETFGGQLSDAERESLLSTLGNVDLSAKEREQAVKSFIESKKRQLDGYKRQLGISTKQETKSNDDPLGIL